MAGSPNPIALSERGWRITAALFCVFLLPVLVEMYQQRQWIAPLFGAALLYSVSYVFGLWPVRRRSLPWRLGFLLWMFGLYLAIESGTHGSQYPMLSFVLVTIMGVLRPPAAIPGGLALVVGVGLFVEVHVVDIVVLVASTVAMLGMFTLVVTNQKLSEARNEVANAAVERERARFARDLHDVLGHSLTTITVKLSLMRRLLEDGDPEAALREVADLEELSRQALADIRSTVASRRQVSLATELASVRELLRSASIKATLPSAVDDVPPALREPFGHVLREGITNVVRHSGATRCEVTLTANSLEIIDDGTGKAVLMGNGLSGLTERMAALGGALEAGPVPGGGFRLRVFVPGPR
ncbi:two-component system, NarL family, sensor histidine kinase DesK [Amycolatopsis xylanica]|uniref:Two-component system, NarL family, sensor histidine kinase DesK n=1 Tax=Amycolatopsis xylanica TaxID=589385 RepID=A0A1H3DXT0_9PSEU|nr:sensor histidine kinase [Amycolatopsis xylanica]SDX71201.1 two-component system, NarL family, sensor histidine kinase DesK [Amycolatopsis xylanica]